MTASRRGNHASHAEVVVVGAGFGGLGAALTLAAAGRKVVLCEALNYPGGCASTFHRNRLRYEAGATLFSGFGPGQLFSRWVERHGMAVEWEQHDPVMTFTVDGQTHVVPASRDAWIDHLVRQAPEHARGIRAFFKTIRAGSDALWGLIDEDTLTPRRAAKEVLNLGGHLGWMRWAGRPLIAVAQHHGVDEVQPLRAWLDATCQITVQASASEAEAPYGMAACSFLFRGVATVRGGIGRFATELVHAIERCGGEIRFSNAIYRITRNDDGTWCVQGRGQPITADNVVLNALPSGASKLLGRPVLPELQSKLEAGWGAVMLYLTIRDRDDFPEGSSHHQVYSDPTQNPIEGNAALITLGERQQGTEGPVRTATVSTHFRMDRDETETPEAVARVQQRLRDIVSATFPAWEVLHEMPASPRTFQRFTQRTGGLVGGVPRRVGLKQYLEPLRRPLDTGLYLVGDSVFLGQSTLAAAVGGQWVASSILKRRLANTPGDLRPIPGTDQVSDTKIYGK